MDIQALTINFNALQKIVLDSKLYKDAKKELVDGITHSSLSEEKRTLILQQFTSQIALGFPEMIFSKMIQFETLAKDLEVKDEQKKLLTEQIKFEAKKTLDLAKDIEVKTEQKKLAVEQTNLAKISQYEKSASAYKQMGVNLFVNGWHNEGNGLIDKQIVGFDKDMQNKALKALSEQAGMLAQNDVSTPSWMVDVMKKAIYKMTGITP